MYQSIQACRAIASLLVLFFHLGAMVSLPRYFSVDGYIDVFAFGDAGVSFFFVLSGFVITLAHRRDFGKPAALPGYLRKRAVRIYPAYLMVGAAVYLVSQFVPAIAAGMPGDLPTLLMEILLIPRDSKLTGGTGSTILAVAWSLQYEVFFYLLTALLLVKPRLWLAAVAALLALQAAAALGMPATYPLTFFTNEVILLFGWGMVVALIVKSDVRIAMPGLVAAFGIAAFTAIAVYELNIEKLAHRDLAYGLASCFIVVGLARAEDAARKPWKLRWLAALGDASYALYLIHFPLVSLVAKAVRATPLTSYTAASVAFFGGTALSILCALVFHNYVESPVMRALLPRRRKPVAVSVGG